MIVLLFVISGCEGLCNQDGEKCCTENTCYTSSITCTTRGFNPVFKGCSLDCHPIWTCEPISNQGSCIEVEPFRCCKGESCNYIEVDCEKGAHPVSQGCDNDCQPMGTCEYDEVNPPGVCVEKPGAECCLGDDCNHVAVDCSRGYKAEFLGCDADCEPEWTQCEKMEEYSCETDNDCAPYSSSSYPYCVCYNKDKVPEDKANHFCSEHEGCSCEGEVCIRKSDRTQTQEVCEGGGAEYKIFDDFCIDVCWRDPDGYCTAIATSGCDCGEGMCWNGIGCEERRNINYP